MLVSDHRNVPGGKERRKKQLLAVSEMIQDEMPPAKPVVKLVFWVPVTRLSMIQDEITLRRVVGTTFAASGVTKRMIQDTIARPP